MRWWRYTRRSSLPGGWCTYITYSYWDLAQPFISIELEQKCASDNLGTTLATALTKELWKKGEVSRGIPMHIIQKLGN